MSQTQLPGAPAPRVSVVTIFLDEERFLSEAVESVFAQSYADWELLLVDDGSTDASTDVAQDYAERYPGKVRYLEHEAHQNRGMSASRNLAMDAARGEYVAFLDGDDIWRPGKLKDQVAILDAAPRAAAVCGRAEFWYGWTEDPEDADRDYLQNFGVTLDCITEPPALLLNILNDECASPCDLMVRRDVMRSLGGYEESFRGMYEDQAFQAKLCLEHPVVVSSKSWYRYRQHPEAATSQSHAAGRYGTVRSTFLTWLQKYLCKKGDAPAEVLLLVERELKKLRPRLRSEIARRIRKWGRRLDPTARAPFLLFRSNPVSRYYGADRGPPIDRYYIEKFLANHEGDVKGRVLEIQDATYTNRFGSGRVTQSDVMEPPFDARNPETTIVADLSNAEHVPSDVFDCIILTQTLQFVCDIRAAVCTVYRVLRPGGVLLATVPGISQTCSTETDDFWRFTSIGARQLFTEVFLAANVEVEAFGNARSAAGFLYGQTARDLSQRTLEYRDADFDLIVTIRARKPLS